MVLLGDHFLFLYRKVRYLVSQEEDGLPSWPVVEREEHCGVVSPTARLPARQAF